MITSLLMAGLLTQGQTTAPTKVQVHGLFDFEISVIAPWRPTKKPHSGKLESASFVDGKGGTLEITLEAAPKTLYEETYRTPELRKIMPDVTTGALTWMLRLASPKGSNKTVVMAQTYTNGTLLDAMANVIAPTKTDPRVQAARTMILSLKPLPKK